MDIHHNPFHAHIEEFHGISSRDLTNQWNGRHDPSFEDVSSLDEPLSGEFRFIPAMECHTMLRLQKDSTCIVYHIRIVCQWSMSPHLWSLS